MGEHPWVTEIHIVWLQIVVFFLCIETWVIHMDQLGSVLQFAVPSDHDEMNSVAKCMRVEDCADHRSIRTDFFYNFLPAQPVGIGYCPVVIVTNGSRAEFFRGKDFFRKARLIANPLGSLFD